MSDHRQISEGSLGRVPSGNRSIYQNAFSTLDTQRAGAAFRMVKVFDDYMRLTPEISDQDKYFQIMSSSAVDNEIKTELSSAYNSYQEVLSKITDRLAKSAQVPEYIQMFERHPSYHRSPLIPTWQDSYCRGPGEELIDRRERFKALLKDTPFPPKTEELPSTPIVEPVDDERSPNDSAASFMVGARNDSESISGDSTAPSEEGHEQHDSGVNIGEHSDFETIPNGSTATLEEGHEPLNSWVNIGDHSDSETISNGSTTPLEESHEHLDSGFDIADHSHSETIVNDPTPSAASEEQQEQLHFCDRYSGRR